MHSGRLLSGYVLKVAVRRNRWHITLVDLNDNSASTFQEFSQLVAHLELVAVRRAVAWPPDSARGSGVDR